MAVEIDEIHRGTAPEPLNSDWIIIRNGGEQTVSLRGCEVKVARPNARKSQRAAKLDPGFKLDPGSKMRLVAGNPQAKSLGKPPEDDVENYFLFMKAPLVDRPQSRFMVVRGQISLAEAIFDPDAPQGVSKGEG